MRLPDDPNKFTSRFKYVELAKYWEKGNKLVRIKDKETDRPVLFDVRDIPSYMERQGDVGIYTSVFQYDGSDIFDSACMGSLYFDLDANDLELAKREAFRLAEHLLQFVSESSIRLYFSGGKGFHLECEASALGVTPTDKLDRIYRFIAEDIRETLRLETVDFNVYDSRRMWRFPGSRHQRTGLYKVECMQLRGSNPSVDDLIDWAKEPRKVDVPEPKFEPKANAWFREYTYKYEQYSLQRKEVYNPAKVSSFLRNGTSNVKHFSEEKIFDRGNLLRNCSAVRDLDYKARNENYLNHYERLFLCSLLTYSEEAIMYLHELLSKCEDYSFEVSHSHIDDWIKRREMGIGGRPFTCSKASEVGISCSGCPKLEPKSKMVPLGNGKFVESEEQSMPSPIRLAYQYKKD